MVRTPSTLALIVMIAVFALFALFASAAVAAPHFKRYYAKDPYFEGAGGEMEVVEGIEVWTNGTPPRRFELLGYLEDKRHETGLIGKIRMAGLLKAVAKAAKAEGADGVILVGQSGEIVGSAGIATVNGGVGTVSTAPIRKHRSRFAVFRYPEATKRDP